MPDVRLRTPKRPASSHGPARAKHAPSVAVAGVDSLRVDAKQTGNLLDDHVENQRRELLLALRAGLGRAAVHDDARWLAARRHLRPGQRHGIAVRARARRRNLFDGELHPRKLLFPAGFEPVHGIEHELVEMLRAGPRQRYVGRCQRTPQAAPMPVPTRDARHALPAARIGCLHNAEVIPCDAPAVIREGAGRAGGCGTSG